MIIWKIALHDEKYLTKANLFPWITAKRNNVKNVKWNKSHV